MKKRNRYSGIFKARVSLEAIKGDKTLAELSNKYQIHTNQITTWKKKLLTNAQDLFKDNRRRKKKDNDIETDELYRQIGQLKVELDWLKKKSGLNY